MEFLDLAEIKTTTSGTGAYDITGSAASGFQDFTGFSAGAEVPYRCSLGADYEIGLGTISGTTLVRTTIHESTNSDAAVNWADTSEKTLTCVIPAWLMSDLSGLSNDAADITIDDTGSLITATNAEDALQENRTAIDLNTTHSESAHAPAGAEVNVNADWDSSSGDAEILNKPTTITSAQATAITANTAKTGVTNEISNVVEDTDPQLGGNLDLNNKALTNEYTAGEALSARTLCYLKDDGKMWKADADAEATTQGMLALCTETASANDTGVTFVVAGQLTGFTGLTVGGICYVSGTAGAITQTRPTSGFVRVVGYADSATSIIFQPSPVWVEI